MFVTSYVYYSRTTDLFSIYIIMSLILFAILIELFELQDNVKCSSIIYRTVFGLRATCRLYYQYFRIVIFVLSNRKILLLNQVKITNLKHWLRNVQFATCPKYGLYYILSCFYLLDMF